MRLAGRRGLLLQRDALAAALLPSLRRSVLLLLLHSLVRLCPPLVFGQEDVEMFLSAADGSPVG